MPKICNNCGTEKNPKTVPFSFYGDLKQSLNDVILKLWIVILVLIVLLVGTNLAWLIYENSFEDVVVTQEVEQDAENGENYFIGGDYSGETENQNGNQEESQKENSK